MYKTGSKMEERCPTNELASFPNRSGIIFLPMPRRSTWRLSIAPGISTTNRRSAVVGRHAKKRRTGSPGRLSRRTTKRATTGSGVRSRATNATGRLTQRKAGLAEEAARRRARHQQAQRLRHHDTVKGRLPGRIAVGMDRDRARRLHDHLATAQHDDVLAVHVLASP